MMMQTRSWTRVAGLTGVVLASLGVAAVAQAAEGATSPAPIVDVADYPPPLPSGCPGGSDTFEGLTFANGRGDAASSLTELDVRAGDEVTMAWDGLAAGCADAQGQPLVPVTLAAYDTPAVGFDPTVDQTLLPGWATCGAGTGPCVASGTGGQLSFVVPPPDVSCLVQLDAVLGLPLAVVGPGGSFYAAASRGDDRSNMLIASRPVETVPCEAALPATTAVPTTAAPAVLDTGVTATTAPPAVLPSTATAPTVTVPATAALPFTGAHTGDAVALGLTSMLVGTALVLIATRTPRRRPA